MTGNSLSVACTGVHTVAGISLSPELSWISPNGMTLLSENNDSTVTLVIESVHTSQAGLYRCTGVQYSAAYVGERESTSEFSLEVESKLCTNTIIEPCLFVHIRFFLATPLHGFIHILPYSPESFG